MRAAALPEEQHEQHELADEAELEHVFEAEMRWRCRHIRVRLRSRCCVWRCGILILSGSVLRLVLLLLLLCVLCWGLCLWRWLREFRSKRLREWWKRCIRERERHVGICKREVRVWNMGKCDVCWQRWDACVSGRGSLTKTQHVELLAGKWGRRKDWHLKAERCVRCTR